MGNKASYIHLRGSDLRPQFHQFTAVVSHPWPRSTWEWGDGITTGGTGGCHIWCSETALKLPICVSVCPRVSGPQPHPDVKPMAYASTLLQLGMM